MGRFLAVCGWLAWQIGRALRRLPLPASVSVKRAASAIGFVLVGLAIVPLIVPLFDAQPQDVTVQQIMDGTATEPGTWVRVRGTAVALDDLDEPPTDAPGSYGILADRFNPLRSIVVEGALDAAINSPDKSQFWVECPRSVLLLSRCSANSTQPTSSARPAVSRTVSKTAKYTPL